MRPSSTRAERACAGETLRAQGPTVGWSAKHAPAYATRCRAAAQNAGRRGTASWRAAPPEARLAVRGRRARCGERKKGRIVSCRRAPPYPRPLITAGPPPRRRGPPRALPKRVLRVRTRAEPAKPQGACRGRTRRATRLRRTRVPPGWHLGVSRLTRADAFRAAPGC